MAPPALKVAEPELQIVCELAVKTGVGKMVTVVDAGATGHAPPAPLTV